MTVDNMGFTSARPAPLINQQRVGTPNSAISPPTGRCGDVGQPVKRMEGVGGGSGPADECYAAQCGHFTADVSDDAARVGRTPSNQRGLRESSRWEHQSLANPWHAG
jgi:hypothetical protein